MDRAIATPFPEKTLLKKSAMSKKKKEKQKRSLLSILGPKGGVYDDTPRGYMPRSASHHGGRTLKDSHRDAYEEGAETPIQGHNGRYLMPDAYQDFLHEPKSKLSREMMRRGGGSTADMPGTPEHGPAEARNGDKAPLGTTNPRLKVPQKPGRLKELLKLRKKRSVI